MARPDPQVEHLLRRAGFGVSQSDKDRFPQGVPFRHALDWLVAYPGETDVDGAIGKIGALGTSGGFAPNTNITHARQRWLFRMVHSPAPLLERMALLWHHHFATGYNKIAGIYGTADGARMMDAKPEDDPTHQMGQIEKLRRGAFGSFETLLMTIAQDPAMLVWLDGVSNVKAKPQENFARELMELFTIGVGEFAESDVYAAARVFTGWNLSRTGSGTGTTYKFQYNAQQHDTDAKDFTFDVYPGGRHSQASNRIPSRIATSGMQDGVDLIHALANHPLTARRLARRFWTWFISETEAPPESFVNQIAAVYLGNRTGIRATLRAVLNSREFTESHEFQRYAWPVEFVVRAIREIGWVGFSANDALTPLTSMGQTLYEPPDVAGWDLGLAWFTTGGMLARLNFASQIAANQRVALRELARPYSGSPNDLVDFCYDRLSLPPVTMDTQLALVNYAQAGGAWTGSDAQLLTKTAGMIHILAGSADYQVI